MWANLFIGKQSRALWVSIPIEVKVEVTLQGFLAVTSCEPG